MNKRKRDTVELCYLYFTTISCMLLCRITTYKFTRGIKTYQIFGSMLSCFSAGLRIDSSQMTEGLHNIYLKVDSYSNNWLNLNQCLTVSDTDLEASKGFAYACL